MKKELYLKIILCSLLSFSHASVEIEEHTPPPVPSYCRADGTAYEQDKVFDLLTIDLALWDQYPVNMVVIKMLSTSPLFMEMIADLQEIHGTINLIVDGDGRDDAPTGACWSSGRKEIYIRAHSGDHFQLSSLIWEMCNAHNSYFRGGLDLRPLCPNGEIYAFLTEAMEYFTNQHMLRISLDFLKNLNDNPDHADLKHYVSTTLFLDIKGMIPYLEAQYKEGFSLYWQGTNTFVYPITGVIHTNVYRKQFQDYLLNRQSLIKSCQRAIEYKHKKIGDCKKRISQNEFKLPSTTNLSDRFWLNHNIKSAQQDIASKREHIARSEARIRQYQPETLQFTPDAPLMNLLEEFFVAKSLRQHRWSYLNGGSSEGPVHDGSMIFNRGNDKLFLYLYALCISKGVSPGL